MALVPGDLDIAGAGGMAMDVVFFGLIAIAVFAAAFVLFIVIRRARQFKYTVFIWGYGANGNLFQQDKARIVKEKHTQRPMGLKFRKLKIAEEYPGMSYVNFDGRGKPVLNAINHENKLVFIKPHAFYPEPGELKVEYLQSDLTDVVKINEEIENEFKMRDFWEKYGGMLASGMLTIVILIFMIVVIQKFDAFSSTVSSNLGGVVSRVEALAGGTGGAPPG